jgi:putative FmdB family regulatory protein
VILPPLFIKPFCEVRAMPIYEFYCAPCNTIFNFFSRTVDTETVPRCPKCKNEGLERYMSMFAVSRNRGEEDDSPLPDVDETKMEQAMGALEREMAHVDENDPRQAANLMRKLTDMTGLELSAGMEEAMRRMESGEDPEQVEAELGDVFADEDPFVRKKGPVRASRHRPPLRDETLYDLC